MPRSCSAGCWWCGRSADALEAAKARHGAAVVALAEAQGARRGAAAPGRRGGGAAADRRLIGRAARRGRLHRRADHRARGRRGRASRSTRRGRRPCSAGSRSWSGAGSSSSGCGRRPMPDRTLARRDRLPGAGRADALPPAPAAHGLLRRRLRLRAGGADPAARRALGWFDAADAGSPRARRRAASGSARSRRRSSAGCRSATSARGSTCCRCSSAGRGCRCRATSRTGRSRARSRVSRHSFGLEDVTGQLRAGGLFAPLPIAALDARGRQRRASRGGLCESAEGQVRATLSGELAGIALPSGLRGEVRCAEGALLLAARQPIGDGAGQHPDRGRRPLPDRSRRPPGRPAPRSSACSRAGFPPGRAAMCGDSTAPSDQPSNRRESRRCVVLAA